MRQSCLILQSGNDVDHPPVILIGIGRLGYSLHRLIADSFGTIRIEYGLE